MPPSSRSANRWQHAYEVSVQFEVNASGARVS